MITSSQISFVQNSRRQASAFDTSQLRIQQSAAPEGGRTELLLQREAMYHYQSSEQLAWTSSSQVSSDQGRQQFAAASLAQSSSDLVLAGQEAIRISRAALGGEVGVSDRGSLSITAGRYSFYSMTESRSVTAMGTIELGDGATVDFTLALRQQQSHQYEYSESLKIVERPATDPLVINFGTASASLSDALFEFDLDSDGDQERLARLGSGSGYLVLDRNGNGQVDDGSELFGPQSGSGFADLARYDDDGNRWIDADDPVFGDLKVWVQTEDGGEELRSLADVGVRALYVDAASDSFTLTNSQGVPLGQIKATGLYLTTDGEVRTLEELDLNDQQPADVPPAQQSLGFSSGTGTPGNSRDDRIASIRQALDKLNEIRQQQRDYLERAQQSAEAGVEDGVLDNYGENPLDQYMNLIDRIRLELLARIAERQQAAARYQQTSTAQ
ncbi:hypothetical protein [Marinobacter mobilis]|uniref:VCBS repeat-containing protein n=1 Tax=Marinobacter mobilis TaxID=488533 RepID=A0A1H2SWT3_9GAMM|nr:hypothetical protein [Marinobacter mobilis]SDW35987.1 hypothetical protein SAMN04487960_102262 [Marinobacter mobilis]